MRLPFRGEKLKRVEEKGILLLIVVYGLEGIAANLAHPVTPGLLKTLAMPSYMFGLIFAVMQLFNFLFSPFWGALCRYKQPRVILAIGCIGYAAGQIVFGSAQNAVMLIIGRAIAGTFFSATAVASVYTLVQLTTPQTRKSTIPLLITAFTVMGTFGQWIGGYVGVWNLYAPFVIQVALLVFCGVMFFFVVPDVNLESSPKLKSLISKTNPLRSIFEIRHYITPLFAVQFASVFMLSFATTSVSQTFGYFLVDVMHADSSVNGFARGVVGVISIVLNATLTIRIVRSKKAERNTAIISSISATALIFLLLFASSQTPFVWTAIVAMSFDTILVSALQERSSFYAREEEQAMIAGFHNSLKSLGAISGAMIAGVVYGFSATYPFLLAMVLYMGVIATLLTAAKLYRSRTR